MGNHAPFEKVAQLSGHAGAVYALESGREANLLFSGSSDRMVAEWSLDQFEAQPFAIKLESTIYSINVVQDRQMVWIGTAEGGIHLVDLKARKEIRHFTLHNSGIFDMRYHADKQLLVAASGDGTLSVWDVAEMALVKHMSLCDEKLRQAAISPDGGSLAVAAGDSSIRIIDMPSLEEKYSLSGHDGSVYSLAFAPSGKYLVSGGKDAYLRFWNPEDQYTQIRSIPAHNFAIYSIVFSPDGQYCATGSRDKSVKIWDTAQFDIVERLDQVLAEGHINSVNRLFWTTYKNYLVSTGDDRSIIIWQQKQAP